MNPLPGEPLPLGATVRPDGVNFSVFSKHATAVHLLLFDDARDPVPSATFELDAEHHRTFDYWHCFVPAVRAGQLYGYRVYGPWAPKLGHRFDPDKVLLDPYARGVVYGDNWCHETACEPGDNAGQAMVGVVTDPGDFDWGGVERPRIAPERRVIYEMHVRGFTRHPSASARHPGSFDAVLQKIPYLLDLGVTTLQLMPVFQFDEGEVFRHDPSTGRRLSNYWGYSPVSFFAPHWPYATAGWEGMCPLTGFREMVRELHRAGLEVFLDVVYNHTGEGDPRGPTISLRGFDNRVYYLLDPEDRRRYADFSGCGNTLNANHPAVRHLIVDSLRYWVEVMQVDGFRFDLASALCRDERGEPLDEPPLLWEIESDPALLRTKLIAEAWDAGGLYQVGRFPGRRWAEWNGPFRDDVRRFVRGDLGLAGKVAARVTGSADIYEGNGRGPIQSINFVTCHDGFTLADLVSYARKHNEANGEENRDGSNDNHSASCGIEGPTDDPRVLARRRRQLRNFLTILFISHGTPMLLMGDEVCRTQRGNNNAYCQDSDLSWLDWGLLDQHPDVHRFVRALIRLRRTHANLRPARFVIGAEHPEAGARPTVAWFGTDGGAPDWSHEARALAYRLTGPGDVPLYVAMNMAPRRRLFQVPPLPGGGVWRRAVDTASPSPEDITPEPSDRPVAGSAIAVAGRAIVVLVADPSRRP